MCAYKLRFHYIYLKCAYMYGVTTAILTSSRPEQHAARSPTAPPAIPPSQSACSRRSTAKHATAPAMAGPPAVRQLFRKSMAQRAHAHPRGPRFRSQDAMRNVARLDLERKMGTQYVRRMMPLMLS